MVPVTQRRDLEDGLRCEVDGMTVDLRPQDLSAAGLFLPDVILKMDREVEIVLHSPIGDLPMLAQVVQVIARERARSEARAMGSGLLFIHLGDDHRAFIGLSLDALQRSSRLAEPKPKPEAERSTVSKPSPTRSSQIREPELEPAETRSSLRSSAPPPLSPEGREVLRELEKELAALQNRSPWQVLAIAQDADAQAAKQAFLDASRRYHPHTYARFDNPDISRAATELFIAHKKALAALQGAQRSSMVEAIPPNPSSVPSRAQPRVTMPAPAPPRTTGAIAGPVRASLQPQANPPKHPSQTGKTPSQPPIAPPKHPSQTGKAPSQPPPAFATPRAPSQPGKPQASKAPSQPPRSLSPAKTPSQPPIGSRRAADAELAMSAGLKHLAAQRFDEALSAFERARGLNPNSRDPELWTRVCRARSAKARGRPKEAAELYREVLAIDPEQREALAFVGESDRRKRPGFIGKLFGSDDE